MKADSGLELDILAAVLYDPRMAQRMLRMLEREDFSTVKGQALYDAIGQVAKRDGVDAIAPATVRDELRRQKGDEGLVLKVMDPAIGGGLVGSFEPKCRRLRDLRRHRTIEHTVSDLLTETDVDTVVARMSGLMEEVGRLHHREASTMHDIIDELLDERERALTHEAYVKTGLPTLDTSLGGGFGPGHFIVCGARTGVGKTTFAVQVTAQALRQGMRVLYVTLEESRASVVERVIRHVAKLPTSNVEGLFSASLTNEIQDLRLVVATGNELEAMLADITDTAMSTEGIHLVVVDYIGLVRARTRESRVQEVSEVTARLKRLSMDLKVPVLGLAQINRSPMARTDRRPTLSDLRDSGSLEQDADVVILLHRDGEFGGNTGSLRLAKHRRGPVGEFPVHYEYPLGLIVEVMAR